MTLQLAWFMLLSLRGLTLAILSSMDSMAIKCELLKHDLELMATSFMAFNFNAGINVVLRKTKRIIIKVSHLVPALL